GLLLIGIVAYHFLPVASMPNVELPTIRVSASRPGADPAIIAATVAAPLERQLGTIAGVTEITSVSSLGQTSIIVQFDLSRKIEGAARDVQAAINASLTDLPSDLPSIPSFRKFNPAAAPVLILALTSKTVPLSDVAAVEQSTRNSRSAAWFNRQPSVLLIITKQGDSNVIETVDNIKALIPEIKRWIPADIDFSILSDRTGTIRASVGDMQLTLAGSIGMVMLVVFLFLRRATPTIAAGVTVPLSLAGTCALMWCVGFSIDNLSLMALAVSVGFV